MTIQALKRKKQELLASQVSNLVSDTNENLLRVNLSKFFTDLEQEVQSALMEYWNDTMLLQGQVNLILASIHEKHQEYYELIMKHKLQEFHRAEQQGKRLVKRQEQSAMKASKPVKMTATRNNLFGTLKYSEDKLANDTFKASQNTLNRVDDNINQILTDGYKSGVGINEVSRQITERFDQLRTWEATRIARTEIHTAQNMGVMNSYESLGVEYTQWIAASDDRTRESHVEIDREIIPIGSTYSNGLQYPGDTSGPIEEWINCRCSNAPFVLPAGMMAPSFSPFREEDLIPIETEPVQQEPQPVDTTNTVPTLPENIVEVIGEQSVSRPTHIQVYLDDFARKTVLSPREHSQYFSPTGKASVLQKGSRKGVKDYYRTQEWVNEQSKADEIFYKTHNHPTSISPSEKTGYLTDKTLLSQGDMKNFLWEYNHKGRNVQELSAEIGANRASIGKLPNFDEFTETQQTKAMYKTLDILNEWHGTMHKGTIYENMSDEQQFRTLVDKMNKELNKGGMYYRVEIRNLRKATTKSEVPNFTIPKEAKPKQKKSKTNSLSKTDLLKKEIMELSKQIKQTKDPTKKKELRKLWKQKMTELKQMS